MTNEEIRRENTLNGKLRKYTNVGSYPILYLDEENNVLCANCANNSEEKLSGAGVNWEDSNLYCDECSEQIELAYGEE